MPLELLVAGVMAVSLTFYALMGGADYGGGIWDLLATGPRARRHRELIADAIGPIWEANHVWLILVVVLLFTGFPTAYATIATALHIPISLMLFCLVLRGSAFAFQSHEALAEAAASAWSRIFAGASLVTPLLLGITLGAIASGRIRVEGDRVTTNFVDSWLAPFPFAVGIFTAALFAFLAAVYLTLETNDPELREDFRRRALGAAFLVGPLALLVFLLAGTGAPVIRERLARSTWTWPLQIATALVALGAMAALYTRRYNVARACAAGQVALILWGWVFSQFPYLVVPDVTIASAAAPAGTHRLLLIALGSGALLLFPSFYYLFRIFKGGSVLGPSEGHVR